LKLALVESELKTTWILLDKRKFLFKTKSLGNAKKERRASVGCVL
jgi:hypothetical protein